LSDIEERLRALTPDVLKRIRRGIEKESLRVQPDGKLAETPHPRGLGSALTHPHITTDFSESQLELITGVHTDVDACLGELEQIHQVVYREIGEEMLWCASMPCGLPQDDAIPIGRYGDSNVGRMKTVYRIGLSHRYGRRMQTISGIHYNFSLPDAAWPALQRLDKRGCAAGVYRNDAYFALIRNFRRHSWLVMLLFGASPAVCSTFVEGRARGLQKLASGTMYLPHATSLRMGPLGYQSDAQASLAVSYNSLRTYAGSLYGALTEPYPPYEAIGVRDGDDYRQLSTALLQIENEFYGTIRPKRRIKPGERPLHALGERGVEYVEVRLMDLDPRCPIGITADTVRFLDIYLLYCLLSRSPPDNPEEIADINRNRTLVAQRGRDPDTRLSWRGDEVSVVDWGERLLGECAPIAQALDAAHGSSAYREILSAACGALRDPANVASARVLTAMKARHAGSFVQFALEQSVRHREYFLHAPLAREVAARFSSLASKSGAAQREIEASDSVPFETYRQQYLSQDLLGGVYLRPQP
jgi:glutamate--cysteine ligase